MITVQTLLEPWLYLRLGESANGQLCPFCDGGTKKDKSFSITRKEDGVLAYCCHRNKCNKAGFSNPNGSNLLQVLGDRTKEHEVFEEPTEALTKEQLKYFEKVYGITPEELGKARFLWASLQRALWQPVYGPNRHYRGVVLRRYSSKWKRTYKTLECAKEPMLAWYRGPTAESVVIVEDILSALKLSRYHTTVALNGTGLSADACLEIFRNSAHQYLLLDKDAIMTALLHERRWKNLLNITVVQCEKDPKYWDDDQLKQLSETKVPF